MKISTLTLLAISLGYGLVSAQTTPAESSAAPATSAVVSPVRPTDVQSLVQNFQKQRDDFLKEDRKLTEQLKSAAGEERTRLSTKIKEMRQAWLEEQKQMRAEIKSRLAEAKSGVRQDLRAQNQLETAPDKNRRQLQNSGSGSSSEISSSPEAVLERPTIDRPTPEVSVKPNNPIETPSLRNNVVTFSVNSLNLNSAGSLGNSVTAGSITSGLKLDPIKPKVEKSAPSSFSASSLRSQTTGGL